MKIKENYVIADPCLSSMSLTVHISVSLLVKSLRLSNSLKQLQKKEPSKGEQQKKIRKMREIATLKKSW